MSAFATVSLAALALVVACALLFRSKTYAIARGISLTLHTLIAAALVPHVDWAWPAFYWLHAMVFLQSLMLVWARLRPAWFVATVSIPGLYFAAGTLLAFPWAIVSALGLPPHGWWLPYALAGVGVWQSLTSRTEVRSLLLDDGALAPTLRRHALLPAKPKGPERPLRIVQITDPHLGPFMSVARLKRICERAVEQEPDLILLTGDYLTMESQADARWLTEALSPLRRTEGRAFACLGNHDHEAPRTVRMALATAGITLLVDDAAVVETEAGTVQVLGFDFRFRDREQHLKKVCTAHPRVEGALRLALLHDPGAFRHLPRGAADLVLSGHTHGGQVGLVSLSLPFTLAHAFAKVPDHGLWALGRDRLYVHRGTGHYGFPLRLGVPAEESLLLVYPS